MVTGQHCYHGYRPALLPWLQASTVTMVTGQHCYHGYRPALLPWLQASTVTMVTGQHCYHGYRPAMLHTSDLHIHGVGFLLLSSFLKEPVEVVEEEQ